MKPTQFAENIRLNKGKPLSFVLFSCMFGIFSFVYDIKADVFV